MPPKKSKKRKQQTVVSKVARAKPISLTEQDDEVEDDVEDENNDDEDDEELDEPLEIPFVFDPGKYLQQHNAAGKQHSSKVISLNAQSVVNAAGTAPCAVVMSPPLTLRRHASSPNIPLTVKVSPNQATSASLSTLSKRQDATDGIRLVQTVRSNATTAVTSTPLDLSLTAFSDSTIKSIVKTCVKDTIFSQCKFYNRDKHGRFDISPTSMCGQIMKHCNIVANETWWYQMRPVIVKTHTDHRNNCIKRLNGRFKGTSNVRGRTQMWQHMDGSVRDIRKLLQLRDNCGFYCGILDHYAPAVVGSKKWNNDTNMKAFCTTTDIKAFGRHVLSVSDEAFIILVLVNSSPRWMAEIIRTETMAQGADKWSADDEAGMPIPKYTFSRLKGQTNNGGGSGWSIEGKTFFDSLQSAVKDDRVKHAARSNEGMSFNKELYQRFAERREHERDTARGGNQEKQLKTKQPAYQCYDEFDNESEYELDDDQAYSTRSGTVDAEDEMQSAMLEEV